MHFKITPLALARISFAAAIALLVGCGGGGGSSGAPTPPPASASTKLFYESQGITNDQTAALSQFNAQGARGYAFLSQLATGNEFINVYVKDINTSYSYEILASASTKDTFMAQANAQGARGFRYYGLYTFGAVYVKDLTASATYTAEVLPAKNKGADFLTLLNSQGARSFFYRGDVIFGGATGPVYSLFFKNNGAATQYSFALQPGDSAQVPDVAALLLQANAQGQQGARYVGTKYFDGDAGADALRNLYAKDLTQTAGLAASSYIFTAQPVATSAAAFIAQANAQGQAGAVYYGDLAFTPPGALGTLVQISSIYFTPNTACTGILCRAASPL